MEWTEITITVPNDELETAEAIAQMTVPYGIYIEDYANLEEEAMEIAHIDLIDEELLKKDRQHAIVHMYINVHTFHRFESQNKKGERRSSTYRSTACCCRSGTIARHSQSRCSGCRTQAERTQGTPHTFDDAP